MEVEVERPVVNLKPYVENQPRQTAPPALDCVRHAASGGFYGKVREKKGQTIERQRGDSRPLVASTGSTCYGLSSAAGCAITRNGVCGAASGCESTDLPDGRFVTLRPSASTCSARPWQRHLSAVASRRSTYWIGSPNKDEQVMRRPSWPASDIWEQQGEWLRPPFFAHADQSRGTPVDDAFGSNCSAGRCRRALSMNGGST